MGLKRLAVETWECLEYTNSTEFLVEHQSPVFPSGLRTRLGCECVNLETGSEKIFMRTD